MVLSMFVEHMKNYCCNAAHTRCNNYRQILQCCMYCWSLLYTVITNTCACQRAREVKQSCLVSFQNLVKRHVPPVNLLMKINGNNGFILFCIDVVKSAVQD